VKTHKLILNGVEVTPAEFHRGGKIGGGGAAMVSNAYSEAKPLVSDGVGCLKRQVPELRDVIRRHGIRGAKVLQNGQVQFTSRKARARLLAVRGLVDNDGGYGDG
jgi:hypothetical protein